MLARLLRLCAMAPEAWLLCCDVLMEGSLSVCAYLCWTPCAISTVQLFGAGAVLDLCGKSSGMAAVVLDPGPILRLQESDPGPILGGEESDPGRAAFWCRCNA